MKQFAESDLARNTGDLFEAAAVSPVGVTKHGEPRFVMMSIEWYETLMIASAPQVAVSVNDLPNALGQLLDQGIEAHFKNT
jgi:prevent-host-death family protein